MRKKGGEGGLVFVIIIILTHLLVNHPKYFIFVKVVQVCCIAPRQINVQIINVVID